MIALANQWIVLAEWLVTFALHSTIALTAAWLLSRALRRHLLAFQETVLRWSLWVALASSFAQVALLQSPWRTDIVLPGSAVATTATEVDVLVAVLDASASPLDLATPGWWSQWSWQASVCVAAAGGALVGLCWLWLAQRRLSGLLATRQPETDSRVLRTAAEVAGRLGLRQSPHVSRSDRIATPIAFGLVRPEICLPRRAGELGDASLCALLAHEVAHLRAADPAWMWGAAWMQALFPWQLLLLVVRRQWARLVELRCDAIAAQAATPTAVARCLLDVAEWLQPHKATPLVALGMAARPSALRERVEAALRGEGLRPASRGASSALGVVFASALSVAAPGVTSEGAVAAAGDVAVVAPLPHEAVTDMALAAAPPAQVARLLSLSAAAEQEHSDLIAEAASVRVQLRAEPPSPELLLLQATVERRLLALAHMRARLQALLERVVPRNR